MNGREAIEAMLAGKVVRVTGGALLRYRDGFQYYAGGDQWLFVALFLDGNEYELYEEPNPHEPGTYAWAREEHARGKSVVNDHALGAKYPARNPWCNFTFSHAEFETKTWRHA